METKLLYRLSLTSFIVVLRHYTLVIIAFDNHPGVHNLKAQLTLLILIAADSKISHLDVKVLFTANQDVILETHTNYFTADLPTPKN